MHVSLIRHLWQIIDTAQASYLLQLDNAHLVSWLLWQLNEHQPLSEAEQALATNYIHNRLPLIRDLAASRPQGPSSLVSVSI